MGKSENTGFFLETIAACDLKVGRCRQLIEIMKACEYWRSRSFLNHIFSRFCMFCALLGCIAGDKKVNGVLHPAIYI